MTRAHVYISGRVQGVFFRYETKNLADELGVKGWVRNLPDGRVEAVFEGEEGLVKKMIDFCKRGPPGAKVTDIKVEWEDYKGEFERFSIRH
ncbi:MAG: acylphosphatase [Crenarchaeota archaeon]|nr:acylphosphatase [Thermoproteota archaeon]MDW8033610.1 acylphosphatase [Nitrososphaerota archaeon]